METQLAWLKEIGFVDADCYWKWLEMALLIGYKSWEMALLIGYKSWEIMIITAYIWPNYLRSVELVQKDRKKISLQVSSFDKIRLLKKVSRADLFY